MNRRWLYGEKMKKLHAWAIRGMEYLVIGLVGALAIVVAVEVFFRYVLNSSISWYDEFAGYLLVWLTFWGAVLALDRGRHIGFETLVERFPIPVQKLTTTIVYLLIIIVQAVVVYYGWMLTTQLTGETTITLPIPIGVIYLVLPVTGALMLLICAVRIVQMWRMD
ncbi:MAG: TRAP transporter small permease [Thermodesulfobacteriota bacterium]